MGWVCSNCSNANEDSSTNCIVCGASCPTVIKNEEAVECKVMFSNFDALKDSIKNFFKKLSSREEGKVVEPKETKIDSKAESEKPPKEKKIRKPLFGSAFAAPWPEHKIKFDDSVIKSRGYVRSERETINGINGYNFYRADDTSQFIRVEMALVLKMAHKV